MERIKLFCKKHVTKKRILAFFVVRKILALILIFSFMTPPQPARAQVAPVANYVINRAIAGAVAKNLIKRGYAAGSSPYVQTLVALSSEVTALNVASTVVGVGLTVMGAPVWLTIAAGLGVFALGGYLAGKNDVKMSLSAEGIVYQPAVSPSTLYVPSYPSVALSTHNYLSNYAANGARMYKGAGCFATQLCGTLPSKPSTYDPFVRLEIPTQSMQDPTYPFGSGDTTVAFDTAADLKKHLVIVPRPPLGWDQTVSVSLNWEGNVKTKTFGFVPGSEDGGMRVTDTFYWVIDPYVERSANGMARIVGRYASTRTCSASGSFICNIVSFPEGVTWTGAHSTRDYVSDEFAVRNVELSDGELKFFITTDGTPNTYKDADALYEGLTSYQKQQQLDDYTIARLADRAWASASAKPGYVGLPYSNLEPVTELDAAAYLQNAQRPVVGDLLRPAVAYGADTVPIGDVGNNSGTIPAGQLTDVNVVNVPDVRIVGKVAIDWGDSTNTPQPNNWEVGKFSDFFTPFKNTIAGIADFDSRGFDGNCPKPRIDFFGREVTMDLHCALIDEYSFTLAVVFMALWTFSSLVIVLSA